MAVEISTSEISEGGSRISTAADRQTPYIAVLALVIEVCVRSFASSA